MPPTAFLGASMPAVQRTFRDLSQEEINDIEQASVLVEMGWSGAFGWDKLLESKRVLIISEAGSGKTYECRAQCQTMWDKGDPAFYIELAQLATTNLRDLMSADEEARLDAWHAAQSDVATFFLDSIDELKLTLGSFETALKRLGKAVAGQLGRVRIITTTRPIEVDRRLIQLHLPVPESTEVITRGEAFADIAMGRQRNVPTVKEDDRAPEWRNVALMPLSDDQIRTMAGIEGISDPDKLLTDIRARNAEDFARRPQDLIELCADWRAHRRIRTHSEQVAYNIHVKLKPRSDRSEPAELSHDKALNGASRIALAMLLTRKLTIRHSVDADRGGAPGTALDPATILPDWSDKERQTLLERALFGFASYGRVRFHHRSVVEFLAACRLDNLLAQGMPIKAVKRLLFVETTQRIKAVRPSMRPVAAWLAAMQPSIFSEVRGREPNVLLDHADPEALSLSQRADALRDYVQLYGPGGWRGLHVPQIQVHRFASPDLGDQVLSLWQSDIENKEVRELLLEMIGAGPMPQCSDIAYAVAMDGNAALGERLDAVAALVRLNDPRVQSLAQSMAETPALWSDRLLRGVIVRLFPLHLTPDRLCELLSRIETSGRSIDEIEWVLPRTIAEIALPPGYLGDLRKCLTDLVIEGLVWRNEWPHLISKRPHLLPVLAAVCLRLIRDGETSFDVLRSSVIAHRLEKKHLTYDEPMQNLSKVVAELAPPLREAIFWADDALHENLHPETDPWKRLFQVLYEGPFRLSGPQDSTWIRRILADRHRPLADRTMMLHALLRTCWDHINSWQDHVANLMQYVADSPELVAVINQSLVPPTVDPELAALESKIDRQRKANEKREAKNHASWVKFWREVAEHPDTAFAPDHKDSTAWNIWQAMQHSGHESRESGWNRRFIEQYFSQEVVDLLRDAMRSIWRKDRPTLRHERPSDQRGTYLVRWRLGLAAITAEAEDPEWARNLSVDEAELAARYVPIQLNGFPAWLDLLAVAHPAAVERTLGPGLTAELDEPAVPGSFDNLLQCLKHAPAVVVRPFLPRLRLWFDTRAGVLRDGEDEIAALARVQRVLEILLDHSDAEARQSIRAKLDDQLKGATSGPSAQLWLSTLMRLDPAAGTDALERLLDSLEPAATGIAVDIFGNLFGDRHFGPLVNLRMAGFTPVMLLRIVRQAYRHVRPADDIHHEGTYTPGPRDHAERGRNAVLGAILDSKGTEAWAIKLDMVEDPLFAHFRDRLALIAREKAVEDADCAALSEAEVITFDRYGEAPPMTSEDMFAVLVDRLDDLDDLLLQDTSPRAAWALIGDEKVMRQAIAHQLQNASNHVYTVDQEAVTADEKETDIRLRVPSSGQQATIELKIGDRGWSGRDLRDTIKNQLVMKYMAAETCRSGCLLVTVASARNWAHPENGEMLDIMGLRAMLDAEANRIVNEMGGSLRLAIKVLDLRPRLSSESGRK